MSLAKRIVSAHSVIPLLTKVQVGFCPFIGKPAAGTIEFLRRITSPKALALNTKCEVIPEVLNPYSQPYINVSFVNGTTLKLESANMDVKKIFEEIDRTCFSIEWEADMELVRKYAAEQK